MADSMCGPSNALNTFQKHTSVDRTLQQDRLILRQSPSHGFRSSPGPNAGQAQAEFEAFQAGAPPLQPCSFSPPPQNFGHVPQNFHQAGPSNWASDFQSMNISSPPSQNFGHVPQNFQQAGSSNWASDFQRNISSSSPSHQHQSSMPSRADSGVAWHQQFAQQQGHAQAYVQSPVQGMGTAFSSRYYRENEVPGRHGPLQQQTQPEAFDEAAFARAFDQAAQNEVVQHEQLTGTDYEAVRANGMFDDLLEQEGLQNGLAQSIAEVTFTEQTLQSDENMMEAESKTLNLPRIGADSIRPQETEPTQQEQQDAPDELARTAGNLLQSVQHDQSAKFQGSQFLELMRLLRDKEVAVKGDDIVGTNTAERAVGNAKGARPSDYLDTFP